MSEVGREENGELLWNGHSLSFHEKSYRNGWLVFW